MAKITERVDIQEGLYIYLQDNSAYWYARFVLDGTWYSKATKKTNQKEAVNRAIELMSEYRTLIRNNVTIPRTKRAKQYFFPDVADLAIKRMKSELNQGTGKVSYEGYIQTLNRKASGSGLPKKKAAQEGGLLTLRKTTESVITACNNTIPTHATTCNIGYAEFGTEFAFRGLQTGDGCNANAIGDVAKVRVSNRTGKVTGHGNSTDCRITLVVTNRDRRAW